MGHALTCHVVADKNSAAIGIPFQGFLVQLGVNLTIGRICTEEVCSFLQNRHPRITVVGTVIAVNHSNRLAGRRGHQVDFLIDLFQRMLQHHHGEDGSSRRHVARPRRYRIGGGHASACVSLGRSKGNAGKKQAIQQVGAAFRQVSGVLTGQQHLRKNVRQLPGEVPGSYQCVKFGKHDFIIAQFLRIDGEHAGSLADADGVDAGEHIVDIACKSCDVGDLGNMLFAV